MEPNLFRYIWHHTKRAQLWLLCVVCLSLPFYFMTLELPKQIINGPIQGEGFFGPGDTQTVLRMEISLPDWLFGYTIVLFPGFHFDRLSMLVYLSVLFLLFVLSYGLFKFYISTYKGRLGERMLRRLRYDLVDRLLRFPMARFKRTRPSEVASMVKDEVEPLGYFIGEAFVQPAFLITQAATAMVFILLQSPMLGFVAATVVVVQLAVIPRLRRRLLVLGRQRQLTARELAGRVGEVVESINSVRTNDTSNWERADIAGRLGRIFFIRFDIYKWKFMVKFLNNLLAQVTPFVFYLVGGYLAITGRLDIGQLVAVIAAYKDLPTPLKELIDWDQQRLDIQVKYTQVVEQFSNVALIDPTLQQPDPGPVRPIQEQVSITNLVVRDDIGAVLLESTSLKLRIGEAVAVVGSVGSGGEYLAEALGGLSEPESGSIQLDGIAFNSLPESVTGRRIGYVEANTHFSQASLRDALLYPLRHVPLRPMPKDERKEQQWKAEARAAGNTEFDVADDWVDYAAAGASDRAEMNERLRHALAVVDLEHEVYRLGLGGRLPEPLADDLAAAVLAARASFRARLTQAGAEDYVETFDPDSYIHSASILENLIFGVVVEERLPKGSSLDGHPYVAQVLAERQIDQRLLAIGLRVAHVLIDLFGDLAPDNPLLERMKIMAAEDIEDYRAILRRFSDNDHQPRAADRRALLRLAFNYNEPRQRLGLLDDDLRSAVLDARRAFKAHCPSDLAQAVHFYAPASINTASTVQDNLLFGRILDTYADASERVNTVLRETLEELDLIGDIIDLGLTFDIGAGAKRLPLFFQQKLALARAILKRPDLLIVNRAISALESAAQEKTVRNVLEYARSAGGPGIAVFWVLSNPAHARWFDRVITFENGRLCSDTNVAPEGPEKVESKLAAEA
jgi:putative ABC transport system ATP-binding protein